MKNVDDREDCRMDRQWRCVRTGRRLFVSLLFNVLFAAPLAMVAQGTVAEGARSRR